MARAERLIEPALGSCPSARDALGGMGLLGTEWDAELEGHRLAVTRNELTRGFKLTRDGDEIASRRWSLIGLGKLHGSAESDGRPVDVEVVIHWGGFSELDGKCVITVDGDEIPVRHVR